MVNELFEGAKISFMDRKGYDLERKVKKLEQEMLYLDSRLEKEKLLLEGKKSAESLVNVAQMSPSCERCRAETPEDSISLGMGDAPDPWHLMPVQIHRNERSSDVHPTFFFTWNCTPYDFHNNSAQRSIYTLLDHWHPEQSSMSAEQFKKQLSTLLAANAPPPDEDHLLEGYENPAMETRDLIEGYENPAMETRDLIDTLEKKLKDVETKCNEEYLRIMEPGTANHIDQEDDLIEVMPLQSQQVLDDELIFEIFKDTDEKYSAKPLEIADIAKEVDNLEGFIKCFNLAPMKQC